MTDSLSDDARLRATEAQMRRALGLHDISPTQTVPIPPPASPGASSPQRRRFVRDGEVPVSVIRRDQDDGANTNKLDATRQALREQIEAREQAEHLLQEAQATIRDLQTKMAHDRLARDEAIQRTNSEKQVVEQALQRVQEELSVERASRQKAEQERDDAIAARLEAEGRIQEMLATLDALKASQAPLTPPHDPQATRRRGKYMPTTEPSASGDEVLPRRRGRPAKSDQSEAEIVEWWKPGWQKQFR
jgi:flagellar biosynthesis GTPase FlhF